ncbi:MAG TPA: helix-turn-helix transcriptional regulator [Polyangiaceae bacterium]|nr:helix-turn-helix transcriptional regulator [Polyangiaceae bacterium]
MIESAYHLGCETEDWLAGLLCSIARVLSCAPRGAAAIYDATSPNWVHISSLVQRDLPPAFLAEAFNQPPASEAHARGLVNLYRTGMFGSVIDRVTPYVPAYTELLRRFEMDDAAVIIAADPTWSGTLFALPTARRNDSPRTRYVWRKIMAHLAAGLRLRRLLGHAAFSRSVPVEHAEAVLSPQGKIEHARGDASTRDGREALRDALTRIDAARAAASEDRAEHAIELWRGLISGRWSLAEHFERDGRRYFVAFRNDPQFAKQRALSPRELQVLSYRRMGCSNKLIAYSLGLSQTSVVKYLGRAREKLGGKSALDALQSLLPTSAQPRDFEGPTS